MKLSADLLPDDVRARLLANYANRIKDPFPVVKYACPLIGAVWIMALMHPDGDTMFGVYDGADGFPTYGTQSFRSIESLSRLSRTGMVPLLRDLDFAARFPLSVYVAASMHAGRIVEDERTLAGVAAALGIERLH